MVYLIRADDRASFKRCRRQWDLGARTRQDFEPCDQPRQLDLGQALRDALAVYYFPGMWEWNRSIVNPLVHQALDRSLHGQRDDTHDEEEFRETLRRGHELLDAYAAWAPSVDHFTPVRVETDFEVNIPDPHAGDAVLEADKAAGLVTGDDHPIRYTDRVDLLVVDTDDAYWAVQHRVLHDDWTEPEALLLDERTIAWCWGWELFYLGMQLAGTIYNELRPGHVQSDVVPAAIGHSPFRHRRMYAQAATLPRERFRTEGTEAFRRTRIRRGEHETARAGQDLAAEALQATSPDLDIYPSPDEPICGRCSYRRPCLALNEVGDATAVLAESYRRRPPEPVVQEGRLGGNAWSMGRGAAPPRFGRRSTDS